MSAERRPSWRAPGETDWGLPKSRRSSLPTLALALMGDFRDTALRRRATRATVRRLATIPDLRLALGSGLTASEGWHGLDLRAHGDYVHAAELLDGIPAATDSVDALLAEHILEHFWYDDLQHLLRECYRVLREGAPIRVVSPDALHVARLLQMENPEEIAEAVEADVAMHRWTPEADVRMLAVNRIAYQWGEHKALLTANGMTALLRQEGFVGIRAMTTRESHYFEAPPDVHALRFPDEDIHLNFAVEARKPTSLMVRENDQSKESA